LGRIGYNAVIVASPSGRWSISPFNQAQNVSVPRLFLESSTIFVLFQRNLGALAEEPQYTQ
jgi:hypothetical protein